jgi:hypothetical protein
MKKIIHIYREMRILRQHHEAYLKWGQEDDINIIELCQEQLNCITKRFGKLLASLAVIGLKPVYF